MALMGRCRSCGGFVPGARRVCPNCGAAVMGLNRMVRGLVAAVGGVAIPVTLMACYGTGTCVQEADGSCKDPCTQTLGDGGVVDLCVDAGRGDAGNVDGGNPDGG